MKNSKSIREQAQEKHKEFTLEVENLPVSDLKNRIVGMQTELAASEAHKEANEALSEAQSTLTELKRPYTDVRNAVKLKTKYILELIKARG